MYSESAAVVHVDARGLQLRTERQTTCAGCSLKGGCGQYLLARDRDVLDLRDVDLGCQLLQSGVQAGDTVHISLESGQLLTLAGLFYAVPLAALLLATLAASWLGAGEPGLVLAAVVGLGVGIGCSRQLMARVRAGRGIGLRVALVAADDSAATNSEGSIR